MLAMKKELGENAKDAASLETNIESMSITWRLTARVQR